MKRLLFRLGLVCLVLGAFSALGILGFQGFKWLRTGIWPPVPLDIAAHFVRSIGSSWIGLQHVFNKVLAVPLSISVFLLGVGLFWILKAISRPKTTEAKDEPRKQDPLAALSDLKQKDRIQILLSEYAALRAEVMGRTGFGFQTAVAGLLGLTWFMQQDLAEKSWLFWCAMAVVVGCFYVAIYVNIRDIKKAANRVKMLEHEVNSRAGEHLLVWETLSGALTRMGLIKSYFSRIKPLPRSDLPPLDPSYLRPNDD